MIGPLSHGLRAAGVWSMVAGVAVLAILAGTAAGVLDVAHREVSVRDSRLALLRVESEVPGARGAVIGDEAGAPVASSEVAHVQALSAQLGARSRELVQAWPAPAARVIALQSEVLRASVARVLVLVGQHRFAEARAFDAHTVQPAQDRIDASIASATSSLEDQIRRADGDLRTGVLLLVSGGGLSVVVIMAGLGWGLRRGERLATEARVLRTAEQRFRALVQKASEVIMVTDNKRFGSYVSPSVESVTGRAPSSFLGVDVFTHVHREDRAAAEAAAAAVLADPEDERQWTARIEHADGSWRWVDLSIRNLLHDPAVEGLVLNCRDITNQHDMARELEYQALHDALTGLPNRALILDRVQRALLRARRGTIGLALLFIDLDGFKAVNDTYGHAVGDELLRAVTVRLSGVLRESDTVGRLGGDEFVVLAEDAHLDFRPENLATRIREVLRAPFDLDGPIGVSVQVAASIGIAVGQRASAAELLRDADVALYAAKAAGKDCFIVFTPEMQAAVAERLAIETDLRTALGTDQLFLAYQPIFDLSDCRITGVEALLRWRHPTRGLVMPGEFVPVAEETGLIIPVGRWVMREACRQVAEWSADGCDLDVSVNVSGRQLSADVDIAADVAAAVRGSGIAPGRLTVEITESMLAGDTVARSAQLHALKALGVRIAIDDFGTGYSSLSQMEQFPVDALKIDRSFISRINGNGEPNALIHLVVQLGKTLGIETVAEGIEEQHQLECLQREHCDTGQGYLLARPLTPQQVRDMAMEAPRGSGRPGAGATAHVT